MEFKKRSFDSISFPSSSVPSSKEVSISTKSSSLYHSNPHYIKPSKKKSNQINGEDINNKKTKGTIKARRMHPRNIYANRTIDFHDLALNYPEIKPYLLFNPHLSQYNLDWKKPQALLCYTKILLKEDFNIEFSLSLSHLCPPLPRCLNYLLWIEDLLPLIEFSLHFVDSYLQGNGDDIPKSLPSSSSSNSFSSPYKHHISSSSSKVKVRGIDIGTGASCIFPLLGNRHFGWKFTATDIDQESLQSASINIHNNHLDQHIQLVYNPNPTSIFQNIVKTDDYYSFSMCNPPFFDHHDYHQPSPQRTSLSTEGESYYQGGEIQFIIQMIRESQFLTKQIGWFTTMVGIKKHLSFLKKALYQQDIAPTLVKTGELFQGHQSRWVLGWTYQPIKPTEVEASKSLKKTFNCLLSISFQNLIDLLNNLIHQYNPIISLKTSSSPSLLHVSSASFSANISIHQYGSDSKSLYLSMTFETGSLSDFNVFSLYLKSHLP